MQSYPAAFRTARCASLLILLASARILAAENAGLRARFETEAPKSWSQLEGIARQLDIEGTQRQLRPDSELETKISVKTSGANVLQTLVHLKVPEKSKAGLGGKHRVACRNSTYSFELEKNQPDLPWLVTFVGPKDGAQKELEHVESMLLFPMIVFDRNLIEWYRSPDFSVKNVEWADRRSGKLAAVTFESARSADERYWIHDGVLYLNPERLWAIQECEFDATNAKGKEEHVVQETEFTAGSGNLPLVQQSTVTAETGVGRVQVITHFDHFAHREIPEQEFTLTAFGLPEIQAPSLWASARVWLMLTVAAIFCIVIAALIRRRARVT